MNLKKMERYLRVNLLGAGPRLMKKEFTGPRSHKGWETLFWSYHKDKTTKPGNLPTKQRFLFFRYRSDRNVLSHSFLHSQKTRCRRLWPHTLWNILYKLATNFLAELRKHSATCSLTARLAAVDSAWPQARLTTERARSAVPLSKTLFCEYSQLQSLWTFLERKE